MVFESSYVHTGTYALVAVVCNHGEEHAGHSTCFVGDPAADARFYISDADVQQVPGEAVMSADAFVLVYQQKEQGGNACQ
jgi:ubiquitin C-terminal hydrolase